MAVQLEGRGFGKLAFRFAMEKPGNSRRGNSLCVANVTWSGSDGGWSRTPATESVGQGVMAAAQRGLSARAAVRSKPQRCRSRAGLLVGARERGFGVMDRSVGVPPRVRKG